MGTGGVFLRRARARFAARPTGFLWVKEGRLAASGLPSSKSQLQWISDAGIASVLTLTERPLPQSFREGSALRFAHVPMADHEPPSVDSLAQAVSFIEQELAAGRPVLVHCLAGQGRTMTAIACYLVKAEGLAPTEAIARLRELRRGAVEGRQDESVAAYAKSLNGGA